MRQTVYKFQGYTPNQGLIVPMGKVLTVGVQNQLLTAWVLVDLDGPQEASQEIEIFGTGHPIPDRLSHANFINTFFAAEFVFHAFVSEVPMTLPKRGDCPFEVVPVESADECIRYLEGAE